MAKVDMCSDLSEDSNSPDYKMIAKLALAARAKLFGDKDTANFKILVGDETIHVHKFVLQTESLVFEKMFGTDCEESNTGEVTIGDFEYDVVMQMLEYMYKGKAAKMDEMAAKLLAISEKYDVQILKRKAEKSLIPQICVNNALSTLYLANANNAERLEKAAMDFIDKHYAEIRETEKWGVFEKNHPNLLLNLLDHAHSYSPPKKRVKLN